MMQGRRGLPNVVGRVCSSGREVSAGCCACPSNRGTVSSSGRECTDVGTFVDRQAAAQRRGTGRTRGRLLCVRWHGWGLRLVLWSLALVVRRRDIRLLDVREPRVDVRALPLSVGEERSHWLQLLPLLRQTKTVAVVSKVGLCEQQSQTLSIDRSDTLSAEHMIRLEKKEKRLLAFSSFLTQVLKMTCTRALLCVL